jgi:hypothetical protein
MRRFLVVGCGGSGGATLAYLMDQLRSDLAPHGVDRLPRGWRFVHIDVPSSSDAGPDGLDSVQEQGGVYVGCGPVDGTYRELDDAVSRELAGRSALDAVGTWAPREPRNVAKPISVGAGQARAVGRMITLNRIRDVAETLRRAVTEMGTNEARVEMNGLRSRVPGTGDYDHGDRPVVLVVSSMAGGAGASMALDVCRLLTTIGDIDPNLMGVFMVAPNIFDSFAETARAGVRPNALAMLGEIVASQTGAARRHDVRLLAALGQTQGSGEVVPFARVFPVGRYSGVDRMQFGDGRPDAVYRGLGRGLAGLVLSGTATDQFVSYDLGNNLSDAPDRSLLGWAADPDRLPWGSFGFAALSMGRDRYAEYAAQRMSRSVVERLLRGHLQPRNTASSGEQAKALLAGQWPTTCTHGLHLPDLQVAADQADAALGAWISGFALPLAEADSLAGAVTQQHIDPYIPNPTGIPAQQWLPALGQLAGRRALVGAEADRAAAIWAFRWHRELQSRVDDVVTDAVSRLGLPYAVALVERLVQHCLHVLAPTAKRLTAHAPADVTAVPPELQGYLAGLKGPVLNGRQIVDQLSAGYRLQVRNHIYARSAGLVEQLLVELTADVLQPLSDTLTQTLRELERAESAQPTGVGLARLATDEVSAWPSDADTTVSARFTEAGNEVLLTSSTEFAQTYVDHVRRALGNRHVGEFADVRDTVVGQVVSGLWSTTGGNRPPGTPLRRAAEWRAASFPLDPATNEPRTPSQARYDLFLGPRDVLVRARAFIARTGESFAAFSKLSLRDFVLADGEHEGDRRRREQLVVDKFTEALTLARPLVGVHAAALRSAHGSDVVYRYKFSEVPLVGLDVQHRVQKVLTDHPMTDQASRENLDGALSDDRLATRIDVFGSYPNYSPLVFDAVLGPAAEQWARPGADGRRQFWEWRRARPLDAALPMGDRERETMVAGWFVGQIIGSLRIPAPPHTDPVRIWDDEDHCWLDFPDPLLTPPSDFLAEYDWLPAVLESSLLALAHCQQEPVMSSLRPYQVLRALYDDTSQDRRSGLLGLAAHGRIASWLDGGPAPGGGVSRVPGVAAARTPEERADAATAWLEGIRDLAGTHFLPPGDGAPGGGTFSVINKRRQASATPIFRDVAEDVHRMSGELMTLVGRVRDEVSRPVGADPTAGRITVPAETRFEAPKGGTF